MVSVRSEREKARGTRHAGDLRRWARHTYWGDRQGQSILHATLTCTVYESTSPLVGKLASPLVQGVQSLSQLEDGRRGVDDLRLGL